MEDKKKNIIIGTVLLFMICIGSVFQLQTYASELFAVNESEFDQSNLPTGLIPYEVIEVDDVSTEDIFDYSVETIDEDDELFEMDLNTSEIYASEWDRYSTNYYYNLLDEDDRQIWNNLDKLCRQYLLNDEDAEVYNGNYRTMFVFTAYSYDDRTELLELARIFRYSNPQYYFLNTTMYVSGDSEQCKIAFGVYSKFADASEREIETSKVKEQAEIWISQVGQLATEKEQVKEIHDIILEKVSYDYSIYSLGFDEDLAYSQSCYSVFCKDLTVCAGYTQAFSMLCNAVGIDCISVTSSDHQWNKARIDDSWYNIDCTWDDQDNGISYNYFGKNDDEFHRESSSHVEEEIWQGYLPVCSLETEDVGNGEFVWPIIEITTSVPQITLKRNGNWIVTMKCQQSGVDIYYTLNGKKPSVASTKAYKYQGSFKIDSLGKIRAIAVKDGQYDSEIVLYDKGFLIFDGNNETEGQMSDVSYEAGSEIVIPDCNYKRKYYHFVGWNTKANGSGEFYEANEIVSTKNWKKEKTLYAQWEENVYKITYEMNGGTNNLLNPSKYASVEDTFDLEEPTKKGYVFKGWYKDNTFTQKVTKISEGSSGDKKFYAKWEPAVYSVKYEGNGSTSGTMENTSNCVYNKMLTIKKNAYKRLGYTFTGWNTKADGSGKSYAQSAQVKNLTSKDGVQVKLYAQWKIVKYEIQYSLAGGVNNDGNPSYYTVKTAEITLKNPTKKGYTFLGWYKDGACKENVTKIKKGSTGKKTFYAKWKRNQYQIEYVGNGSTSGAMKENTKCKYNMSYELKQNAYKRKGYTFAGWNTKADGSGKKYENGVSVKNLTSKANGTVKLYAQWKPISYKIIYEVGKGTNHSENPLTYTIKTKGIVLKKPTRKGYTFEGWYTESDYRNKITKIAAGSIGKKTLYAKWKVNRYTVMFDGNGATSGTVKSLENCKYNTKYILTSNSFKRKGYTFTGWNTKADGSGKNYKNKAQVKNLTATNGKTVTLYAKWKKNVYKINYVLGGGENNSNNPTQYTCTSAKIVLQKPVRKGYTFAGWYKDVDRTQRVTYIATGSTGNKTFYAKWNPIKYDVVFDGNGATGGSTNALEACKYGNVYTLRANGFKRTGYTFEGWNTKANGSGKDYAGKAQVKNLTTTNGSTITLYAQWKENVYSISYVLDGGENHASNPTQYTFNYDKIVLQKPVRKGYKFVGWYKDAEMTQKVTTISSGSTGNKTFYAKWDPYVYDVFFDGNDETFGEMYDLLDCKYGEAYELPKNAFEKDGYVFKEWNTKADGSGTSYMDCEDVTFTFEDGEDVIVLYAQWETVDALVNIVEENPKGIDLEIAAEEMEEIEAEFENVEE